MLLFAMQVGEAADQFSRYAPLLTFVGTAVFYALMFHVTNRTKQDLKEIKDEFSKALKDSGERAQSEILRVHVNFEEHIKQLEQDQIACSTKSDSHFMEVRQNMSAMREELYRISLKFAEADTALKLMAQRMDFEFERRDTEKKRGA